jgi:hypothetical protein
MTINLLIALTAVSQCGPNGCGQRFGPPMFAPPMFYPPQYVSPPVYSPAPQIVEVPTNAPHSIPVGKPVGPVPPSDANGWPIGYPLAPPHPNYPDAPEFTAYLARVGIKSYQGFQYPGDKAPDGAVWVKRPQQPESGIKYKSPPKPATNKCPNPGCKCETCDCKPCECRGSHPAHIESLVHTDNADGIPNFGLDSSKIGARKRYSIMGKDCSKERCFDAIGDGSITDDSKLMRLSCIGTEADCKRMESDLHGDPNFSDLKGSVTFQSYRPDDPMIKDLGVAPGAPAVYLQDPTGKVLARWENYVPASVVGELRKRKPDYDPNKDPRPDKPGPSLPNLGTFDFASLLKNPLFLIVAGIFLLTRLSPQPVQAK